MILLLLLSLCSTICALDCNGAADIVIAVPGSKQQVPQKDFVLLEDFLINMINYYTVSPINTNIGLILYGSEPKVINQLNTDQTKRDINTQVSMLAQRELYHNMDDGLNIIKAMDGIIQVHKASNRPNVAKIGVIMIYGSEDLSTSNMTIQQQIELFTQAGKRAADDGITMFAVSVNGSMPGFEFLGKDRCSLFSLGEMSGLPTLLPYLASATCYVTDPDVNPEPNTNNCFPEIKPKSHISTLTCPPPTSGFYPDENNCAYFIQCTQTGRVRTRCSGGLLYDMNIERCNYAEVAKCYEK